MVPNELFNYKNAFMEDILTDEEILPLITEDEDLRENPQGLVYTQVFPYEHIPETVTAALTFICLEVEITEEAGKTFHRPVMKIEVFTHESLMRLPHGGQRTDRLTELILKKLEKSRSYSPFPLRLNSLGTYTPAQGFYGHVIKLCGREFN